MKAKKKKTFLSVIIPCYNEGANLKRGVLQEVDDYLKKQDYSWEVIISDDGSSDKSLRLARRFSRRHPNFSVLANPHRGKPWAVWAGIQKAKGDIVLFADMDQSTPIEEIEKLLPWFGHGFDVVIGSRGRNRSNAPLIRKLMAWLFLTGRRLLLLSQIIDTQCGFKAFKRKVALEIFPHLDIFRRENLAGGWRVSAFDVELLFLAQKMGYQIKEVPVKWQDRDVAQGKNKNFFRESINMLQEILRVKINDLLGRYHV